MYACATGNELQLIYCTSDAFTMRLVFRRNEHSMHQYTIFYVCIFPQTLAAARKLRTPNAVTKIMDLNPKSIKTEELYGFISMATREWKDGLLSKVRCALLCTYEIQPWFRRAQLSTIMTWSPLLQYAPVEAFPDTVTSSGNARSREYS